MFGNEDLAPRNAGPGVWGGRHIPTGGTRGLNVGPRWGPWLVGRTRHYPRVKPGVEMSDPVGVPKYPEGVSHINPGRIPGIHVPYPPKKMPPNGVQHLSPG